MKPDSESRLFKAEFVQSPVSKNYKLALVKTQPRHKSKPSLNKTLKQQIDEIPRHQWISDAAYFKALARGFAPGHELNDWLQAEQDYIEMMVELFLSVFREDGAMTKTGLQQLAVAIGVQKPERIDSKTKLIRLIQKTSRHRPCFRTKPGELCQDRVGCQWSAECQKLVAEWCG